MRGGAGHIIEHDKDLEKDKWVKIVRWGEVEEAHRFIRDAMERGRDGVRYGINA